MNEDFKKGLENGIENLDKSNYEDYLSSEVTLEWLNESKQAIQLEIEQTKEKLENARLEKLDILHSTQEIKHQYDSQNHEVNSIEKEIARHETKIEEVKEEKSKNPLYYPLLAGIIYLAAGVVFLLGDLIISHEIVAYALNIKNNVEAWAFACGLAGVTLLLKPAYERLVEEPYLKNPTEKTKRVHAYFQTTLVTIAIVTLTVLGWFRYEAYKVDKLKASINSEIKALQLSNTPLIQGTQLIENPEVTKQIETKMKEVDSLNKELVNSNWALLSFVLSGVLFAIAGAICFGIAFPILSSYWKRWFWHNPSINRANRRIKKLSVKLTEAKKPWFENASKLDLNVQKMEMLPDMTDLKTKLAKLEESSEAIAEKIKLAMESSRTSIFNSGYDSGHLNKELLSEEELKNYRNSLLENLKNSRESGTTPKVYKTNGLRPHQALRKAITDSFADN
jgi:hypothetical protein